jgi:hypothetical protein
MRKLGYKEETLAWIGYSEIAQPGHIAPVPLKTVRIPSQGRSNRVSTMPGSQFGVGKYQQLRELIKNGYRAKDLKAKGFNVLRCKNAGLTATELSRIGFTMDELVNVFDISELRYAGFMVQEMDHHFSIQQLLEAGYAPAELITAGYSKKEVERFACPTCRL